MYLIDDVQLLVGDLGLKQSRSVDVSLGCYVVLLLQVEPGDLEVYVHLEVSTVDPK